MKLVNSVYEIYSVAFAVAIICFPSAFLLGSHCENNYIRNDIMPEVRKEAYMAGYEEGYLMGLIDGASSSNTKAYNDGIVEGARQMIEVYKAEGAKGLEPQYRVLKGLQPQGK